MNFYIQHFLFKSLVTPLNNWVNFIVQALKVLTWPALTFIVLFGSRIRSAVMGRILKVTTDFAAVTATACLSSFTLNRPKPGIKVLFTDMVFNGAGFSDTTRTLKIVISTLIHT